MLRSVLSLPGIRLCPYFDVQTTIARDKCRRSTGWTATALARVRSGGGRVRALCKTRFLDPQNPTTNFRTNYYFRTHFTMMNYSAPQLAATTLLVQSWV